MLRVILGPSLSCADQPCFAQNPWMALWRSHYCLERTCFNFCDCLELRAAVGGGVTMHGDRSKPVSLWTFLRLLSACELAVAMDFPSLLRLFKMIGNCFTPIHQPRPWQGSHSVSITRSLLRSFPCLPQRRCICLCKALCVLDVCVSAAKDWSD